ncbi:hypothetical protein X941_5764 [Burkholderia pseudomallei MSHR5569]|nr:hypothetical protein X941_5764 [Burkholderia pseudomallei MSHR5569]
MAAEADRVPDAVRIAADLRHLVARVAHEPAPRELHGDIAQLRIDAQQVAPEQPRDCFRPAFEHRNAAAPQNSRVGERPVVVEREAGVVDGRLARDRVGEPRAERLGRDHVGRDRQHRALDARIHAARIAAAREHHAARAHRAAVGRDDKTRAVAANRARGRMLVDPRAALRGRGRDAEHVLQRMEVERVALEEAAAIAVRLQPRAQCAFIERLPVDAERLLHQLARRAKARRIVEPVREDHAAVDEFAIDAVARGARADQLDRVDRQAIERAGGLGAERAQQVRVVEAIAAEHEAAVAARRAEADRLRVEQRNVAHAALDEPEGCRQAGQAAADDAHVGIDAFGERGVGRARDRGFVVVLHADVVGTVRAARERMSGLSYRLSCL